MCWVFPSSHEANYVLIFGALTIVFAFLVSLVPFFVFFMYLNPHGAIVQVAVRAMFLRDHLTL